MASAARDLHYERGAVYGDLAYDLDRETREHMLRHAGEPRREEPRQAPAVRSVSPAPARQRQHVSALSVVGFLAVAALTVLVLFQYVKLTEISADVATLQSQLATLETDHVSLTAQYQRMYDLSTVKEAAEAAGMSKPRTSQVYYVDLSGGDSAVVYQQEEPGLLGQVLTSLNHGIYAVVEYFE